MADTKQINAKIPEELHRAARIKAVRTGKTMTQVIRELLAAWVKDDDANAIQRGARGRNDEGTQG